MSEKCQCPKCVEIKGICGDCVKKHMYDEESYVEEN
jgi:hypothetical protein